MQAFKQVIYSVLIFGAVQTIFFYSSSPAKAASGAMLSLVLAGILTAIYWIIKKIKANND